MFYVILDGIPYDFIEIQNAVKEYKTKNKIPTEPQLELDEGQIGIGILENGRTLLSYIQHEKDTPTGIVTARVNQVDDVVPLNCVLLDPNPRATPGYHCGFFGESQFEDYNMMPNNTGRKEAEERIDYRRKRRSSSDE